MSTEMDMSKAIGAACTFEHVQNSAIILNTGNDTRVEQLF